MTHDLVAVLLGLLAGVLSALFGVGGGIVFVPTLIFLGNSARVAVATSLAAMVPVVLVGSWRQTRYGAVNWRDATVIGLASVPTAKLGEIVADSLPNDVIKRLFALVLVIVAVQLAVRALRPQPVPVTGSSGFPHWRMGTGPDVPAPPGCDDEGRKGGV